jgi:hypothetical protein
MDCQLALMGVYILFITLPEVLEGNVIKRYNGQQENGLLIKPKRFAPKSIKTKSKIYK